MDSKKLTRESYTVGWVCALDCEINAARALLDKEHDQFEDAALNDENIYILGQSGNHNIVITFPGAYGNTSTAQMITNLIRSFPNIRFGLMVGIGGAAPNSPHLTSPFKDIRVGDIVVSEPKGNHGGVLNYDMGKWKTPTEFSIESHLDKPPVILQSAVKKLAADQRFEKGRMLEYIKDALNVLSRLQDIDDASFPGWGEDRLFEADCPHVNESGDCSLCDQSRIIHRLPRPSSNPVVHHGLIASGNAVMRSAHVRDRLREAWNVLCFEMEAAGLMNYFPCVVIRGLCDYSDSHKTKRWQSYAAVVAAAYAKDLLRVIGPEQLKHTEVATTLMEDFAITLTDVDKGVRQIQETLENTFRDRILHWLNPIDHERKHSQFFLQHQQGTGKWFLDSPVYQQWVQEPKSTLLCQGIPGAGKTILTSIIVHHLHETLSQEDDIGFAYYYFNFRHHHEQTFESFYSSLLKQLSQRRHPLPECVTEAYAKYSVQQGYPLPAQLLDILETVIMQYRKVFIVVDALDELVSSNETRRWILNTLFRLQKTCPISFLATSRPVSDIVNNFQQISNKCLEIRASDDDVRSYIDGRLDNLRSFASEDFELRDNIKEKVVGVVNGMFLLAKLHLDFLADQTSRGEISNALESLQTGSDESDQIYFDAMTRIQCRTKRLNILAMRTLELIINVKRPLTAPELQHALAAKSTPKVIDSDTIPELGLILDVCSGLVTVDQTSNIICLVHATAQEYFERKRKLWFPDAHSNIATACLSYLSMDTCDHPARATMWPFYDYAAQYWRHHVQLHNADNSLPFDLITDKTLTAFIDKSITPRCFCGNCFRGPNKASSLHLSAYLGLSKTVEMLITRGIYCDSQDARQRTPLAWVSDHSDIRIAQTLIENGADPNHVDDQGCTPLSWAAGFGNAPLVKLLLRNGARADIKNRRGLLPLDEAMYEGHTAVARALLEHGLYTVDSDNAETWEKIFRLAEEDGLMNIIKEKNMHSPHLQRAMLFIAANEGLQSDAERLLDAGAYIDGEDHWGGTPLLRAIDYGQIDMVKLLIERGANIHHRDCLNRDMLHGAAVNGQAEIIPLLFESDISLDVNNKDNEGITALHDAARKGYVEVVKVLLARGANPHIGAANGATPITHARDHGRNEVLEILQAAGHE